MRSHTKYLTMKVPARMDFVNITDEVVSAVNESGVLGQNQLVFLVDRQTHQPIIRVEDRETHEVLLQLPPEYVLRLAEELRNASK